MSLFIYQHGDEVAYLLIYVVDMILTTSSTDLLEHIISSLHKEFDMTDLGAPMATCNPTLTSMFLSQKKYAFELLDGAPMATCNPTLTPSESG